MIKKDTIISTTDTRLTLLQWLKKVEKALKDSTVTGFTATPTEDGKVVFAMTFADGSTISTDPITVPAALDEVIKYNKAGARVEVGADLDIKGAAILISGRSYRILQYGTSDSSILEFQNQTPEGLFSTALKIVAKNNGSYSVFLHDTPIATKNDIIDLRMDVSATYSKARYQHSVTIKFDNQNTAVLAFTAMSSNSQKVTSFQDLAAVFGGRRLACSGGDKTGARYTYLDTHPSTPNDYVVGYINAAGFHTDETLGTLTGTGLTVEDDVSIP